MIKNLPVTSVDKQKNIFPLKTIQILTILVVILILSTAGYFIYRNSLKKEPTSLQIAQTGIDWFINLKNNQKPSSRVALRTYTCDFKNECDLRSENSHPHRNTITSLWAKNRLYLLTQDPQYLASLETDIQDLFIAGESKKNDRIIWSTNYYHCSFIQEILQTNHNISSESKTMLTNFCLESVNESIISSSDEDLILSPEALVKKVNLKVLELSKTDPGSIYIWPQDTEIASLSAKMRNRDDLIKQIIYLDDMITKAKIEASANNSSAITPEKIFEINNLLNIALSSYEFGKLNFSNQVSPITMDMAIVAALKNYQSLPELSASPDMVQLIAKLENSLTESYSQQLIIDQYLFNSQRKPNLYEFGLNTYLAQRLSLPDEELLAALRKFYIHQGGNDAPQNLLAFASDIDNSTNKVSFDLQDNHLLFGLLTDDAINHLNSQ